MKSLFDETQIKTMKLKNRFVRSAVSESLAKQDGHMTEELYTVYRKLAEGGVGTIITGYAYIQKDEQPGPGMMGIYDESFIEEYRSLTDMVHQEKANIVMQIVYGGSQTELNPPSCNILGPSAIMNEISQITPKEMTFADIQKMVKAFGEAALRVKQSGFDGVEIHAAHGYLLSQFLSPYYNRRTDTYGGILENRARILYEVFGEIRKQVGDAYPIWVKINSQDFMEDGFTEQESLEVCKKLDCLGIDGVEVSGGTESSRYVMDHNLGPSRTKIVSENMESYFHEYAEKLAEQIHAPVILAGGNRSFDRMSELLNSSKIAYFSLARPFIAEPDLVVKWKTSDKKKKAKCVSCNRCLELPGKKCILNV